MSLVPVDRRAEPRVSLVRPCKIYDPRSRRYHGGATVDCSLGGVRLELDRPLDLSAGDEIYLGVALKRSQGMIPRQGMIRARVIWATRIAADRLRVAVSLAERMALRPPPLRRAA